MSKKPTSRRDFIRLAATSTIAAGLAPGTLAARPVERLRPDPPRRVAPSDRIGLATIGMGIIGFIDTNTALRVPGVELVAAADLYDGRLQRAKEVYGPQLATTRDYREILARPDVDAVIVSTPDHWHARIALDAMAAGKDVYLEKPMVHDLEEGPQLIEAQQRTKRILQVGSQFASSLAYRKAQELYEEGAIGQLNMVEATYNRNSAIGAWQYSIPTDASPQTIDWDRFLGDAPKRPFDPVRFFRWRNYWDYGTGVAGDLYVHLFTGIHRVLSSNGPTSAVARGNLSFWKDGRDAPDVMMGLYEYPETPQHPAFLVSLQTNFADGGGGGSQFRFIGNEGVLTMDGPRVLLTRRPLRQESEQAVLKGYNSVQTFSEAQQEDFAKQFRAERRPDAPELAETREFREPEGYDSRLDHFGFFFEGMRTRKPVYEDAVFGYRAAAPALLANLSYRDQRPFAWDPVAMKLGSRDSGIGSR